MPARKRSTPRRKSQSGRNRPLATFSLSPEALELLEQLATHHLGVSKSAVVEMAIRAAARREGL